jgi:glutathione S-transferase
MYVETKHALGYLSLRLADVTWAETYPNLARLHEKLMLRPAFADTVPQV